MYHFRLERLDRSQRHFDSYSLSDDQGMPTNVGEFDLVRLCCEKHNTNLDVFIGNLKLTCIEEAGYFIYSLEDMTTKTTSSLYF